MTRSAETTERLETFAQVLWRCWAMGFGLLLLWTAVLLAAPGVVERSHGALFNFTPHELMLIHYCGLAFVKVCVLLFLFFPWIAVRWTIKANRS